MRLSKNSQLQYRRVCRMEDDARLIGSMLGPYRILEHIGSGGMAAVYRVRHEETNVDYALKILRAEVDAALDRFGREVVALSRFRHPNVVSVVDFGVTEDKIPFLVMEHVRGPTLEEVIRAEAPMPLARAARFARDIASGLDEAHALGFVHRDVKPANIMIHRDADGRETVKLLDFGVVGLAQVTMTKRLTMTGAIIGTPKYMSPEQCAGDVPSFPADLYALGLVLYEMITGRPVFVAKSGSALMKMHINSEPRPLTPCGGLERLVGELLRKLPAARPESMEVVLAELDRLLTTLPDAPAEVPVHHDDWTDDAGDDDTLPSPERPAADTLPLPTVVSPMSDVRVETESISYPAPAPPRSLVHWFVLGLITLAAATIAVALSGILG